MLSAGETSGDLHGAALARELRALDPSIALIGFGGAEMEAAGASNEELEQLGVGSLHRATHEGDVDNGSVMIGEISGMLSDIKPVAKIIEDIVSGLPGAMDAARKTCE